MIMPSACYANGPSDRFYMTSHDPTQSSLAHDPRTGILSAD